jgi:pimeloyl-ACP methyl ester carboxylesterase
VTTQQKAQRPERRYTNIDDKTIYSEVVGSGTPLVLIHGLAGSSRWWAKNVPALAEKFEVHSVDLLGFGQSNSGPFVLSEAATTLARWMERLKLERSHVVGHSMGGFIAADLAADFSHLVDHLVLVDAAAMPFDRSASPGLGDVIRTAPYLPFSFLDILLPDLYRAGVKTVVKAAYELMTTDIREKLANIVSPSLVIWGENDPMVPMNLGKQLARRLPCKEFVIIKGAGHNPMWEKPNAFNRAILDFLTHVPQAQPARPVRPVLGAPRLAPGGTTA